MVHEVQNRIGPRYVTVNMLKWGRTTLKHNIEQQTERRQRMMLEETALSRRTDLSRSYIACFSGNIRGYKIKQGI